MIVMSLLNLLKRALENINIFTDDCKGYDDITNIKVTGAKSATAKKEGVSSTGQ